MSIARHHAEWLSLVEISGPFLSMPVLMRAFPQGLEAHNPELAKNLRLAFGEWEESQKTPRPDAAMHRAWVKFVLQELLELPEEAIAEGQTLPPGLRASVAEYGETLRPDLVVVNPKGSQGEGKARLLIQVVREAQDLDRPLAGKRWKASAGTRMMELLHATDIRLGLVTNGERWMLVDAPVGDTTGFVSWYATLWIEEPITQRAFRSLLCARRFFGVAQNETLEALLAQSSKDQQEVTDQLGYQVRSAVEMLIQAIDRIDKEGGRTLLAGVSEKRLYEAALTVMMRLVFLFSAEERGLLLLGDRLYDQHYAVSTLRAQLREAADQQGEEVLERRCDAWSRLLATFRAVHSGVQHEAMRLPAYGGALFDPDRFPFLEGRKSGASWRNARAQPLPIHNRAVLHLLDALQLLKVKVPGGRSAEARRLSFRALDIEQIGHVYESLLDHTAVRAQAPVLGLAGSKDKEPEVPLPKLEEFKGKGDGDLVGFLKEQTGRSPKALEKAVAYKLPGDDQRLLIACDNDSDLYERVGRFAGLLRADSSGYPVVVSEGSVYVTKGSDRRTTGTHYTPKDLTEPIVRHTMEPVVYMGPAEGKPRSEWKLRSATEILNLKVCDMAMGSGAFLVQACRYLAERLVEAWEEEEASLGQLMITPSGELSTNPSEGTPLPRDVEERLTMARRFIANSCLYGVDKDPMAVEMAKLSLWLVTLQKDRPFTYLDHALGCGDSLLGLTCPEQIEFFHLSAAARRQVLMFASWCVPALRRGLEKRRQLESFAVNDIRDAEEKARLFEEATRALAEVRLIADLLVGAAISTAGQRGRAFDRLLEQVARSLEKALDAGVSPKDKEEKLAALRVKAQEMLNSGGDGSNPPRKPFHWLLEFPEIFAAEDETLRGFDAIIGNPPFLGGQKITGVLGTDYRDYLVEHIAGGQRGSADLCAYFFLRAKDLLHDGGGFGMLATNTIAQGDTREVGLDQITDDGCVITRAVPSQKWPGTANLEVAHVWVRRGSWKGLSVLEGMPVSGITPFLTVPGAVSGKPYRLAANAGKSFQGSIVLGMGFVLSPEEAKRLIAKDPRNRNVIFPYLNGEDLNSRPDQSPSRWVINFHDWLLDRKSALPGYSGPVAGDYPDCLEIVREKVKPQRESQNDKWGKSYWWRFLRTRPELYSTIAGMKRVLLRARIANLHSVCWVPVEWVYNEKTVVFAHCEFSVLQSTLHESWAREYSSSLRTDMQYTPSDCFETFPFPTSIASLDPIGESYYQHRQSIMRSRREGLTRTYNRFHNPSESSTDIARLRELRIQMDQLVVEAYGWSDLDLGHGFHETKQGTRFTISESRRRKVLARLLKLNHERYEEEVRRGLHEKGSRRKGGARKTARHSGHAGQGVLEI